MSVHWSIKASTARGSVLYPARPTLKLLQMLGDVHPNTRPCYKVPLSCMYSQCLKSRSELQMLWMGACEMFNSTFNVLQLNANGIGNKLRELRVVLERNKVKVAVIQESKLSPKSKNPCIRNYTTVCKDCPHGQGGGLLIFIHRSITSKQPSSPESLSDRHLEELSIKGELGNKKLSFPSSTFLQSVLAVMGINLQ